jgi:hypothetical protein
MPPMAAAPVRAPSAFQTAKRRRGTCASARTAATTRTSGTKRPATIVVEPCRAKKRSAHSKARRRDDARNPFRSSRARPCRRPSHYPSVSPATAAATATAITAGSAKLPRRGQPSGGDEGGLPRERDPGRFAEDKGGQGGRSEAR